MAGGDRRTDRGSGRAELARHSFSESTSAHPAHAISRFCMADRGWLLVATHNRKRASANYGVAIQNPGAYIVHETVCVDSGLEGAGDQGDHTRPRSVRCAAPKIKERRSAYEH